MGKEKREPKYFLTDYLENLYLLITLRIHKNSKIGLALGGKKVKFFLINSIAKTTKSAFQSKLRNGTF